MSIPRISGKLLKQLRKNSGLTQASLAKKAKITQGYIAQIESDKADPKLSVINRILDVLEDTGQVIVAGDIMTTPVIYGSPDEITEHITAKMIDEGYSQLPILNEELFSVGTMFENDLLIKIMKYGPNIRYKPVREVMAAPLPSFPENTAREIIEQIIERLPAVLVSDQLGKIIGIITKSDILKGI